MNRVFQCMDCGNTFPAGYDVEGDFSLEQGMLGNRCVYCYNKKTNHPLDVENCAYEAFNLEHFGVAILHEHVGKTLDELGLRGVYSIVPESGLECEDDPNLAEHFDSVPDWQKKSFDW